jgi:serine/threonine-protein phosphatase 2A regulatory subunit B
VLLRLLLQLCDLYENDSIFDKFGCCMNGPATCFASGTYNNSFKVRLALATG